MLIDNIPLKEHSAEAKTSDSTFTQNDSGWLQDESEGGQEVRGERRWVKGEEGYFLVDFIPANG